MSAGGQIGALLPAYGRPRSGTDQLGEQILLYGLNEAGEAVFSRELAADDLPNLRAIAEAALGQWRRVEVWHGPACVIRLSRGG
jgi:hypothetical protein